MQRRVLGVLIACLVTAVAISGVAFGPGALRNLGNPNAPGDQTGTGPQVTSIEKPTWHRGDTWTYSLNTTSAGMRPDGSSASGSLTRTVVSADASQYNVSLEGSFQVRWMVDPTPTASTADASRMALCNGMFTNATLGGYTWYRVSDLAILKEVRTLDVQGSSMTPMGTYVASYKAFVETSFDPALKVWSFPLNANETWMASSNATIHSSTSWQLTGSNVSWIVLSVFNARVPVRLYLHSGDAEAVVTPAGTFTAISVSVGHPALDVASAPPSEASTDHAMGFDHETPVERDHASVAWFSGTAKNIVQAHVFTLGFRLNLTLKSYRLG
jgi:hypothetical protein